jgi:hypothetical protein
MNVKKEAMNISREPLSWNHIDFLGSMLIKL